MKKIFVLVLLCMASLASWGRPSTSFTVYEMRGDVLFKKAGTQKWIPAVRNIQVDILDSLSISPDGYVRLREEVGTGLYRSVTTGKMRVMDLVIMARKQSRQRVEMQVNDNLKRTMNETEPSMNVYGTGTRTMEELDSEAVMEEAVPEEVQDTVITIRIPKDQLEEFLQNNTHLIVTE